jgi:hypothetical protein
MKRFAQFSWILLALALLALANAGCKSAESENVSSRPWNSPRGFDTGLPGFDQPR